MSSKILQTPTRAFRWFFERPREEILHFTATLGVLLLGGLSPATTLALGPLPRESAWLEPDVRADVTVYRNERTVHRIPWQYHRNPGAGTGRTIYESKRQLPRATQALGQEGRPGPLVRTRAVLLDGKPRRDDSGRWVFDRTITTEYFVPHTGAGDPRGPDQPSRSPPWDMNEAIDFVPQLEQGVFGLDNNRTRARLFAPYATDVRIELLERNGICHEIAMNPEPGQFSWFMDLSESLPALEQLGVRYRFKVNNVRQAAAKTFWEVVDPYAHVVDVNNWGVFTAPLTRHAEATPKATRALGKSAEEGMRGAAQSAREGTTDLKRLSAAVVELHVRDATAHPSSGVPMALWGTFQGLIHPDSGFRQWAEQMAGELGPNQLELELMPLGPSAGSFAPPTELAPGGQAEYWRYMPTGAGDFSPDLAPTPEVIRRNVERNRNVLTATQIEEALRSIAEIQYLTPRPDRDFEAVARWADEHGIRLRWDFVQQNHVANFGSPYWVLGADLYFRLDPQGRAANGAGTGNEFAPERSPAAFQRIKSRAQRMVRAGAARVRGDLAALAPAHVWWRLMREAGLEDVSGEPWTASGPGSSQWSKLPDGLREAGQELLNEIGFHAWDAIFRTSLVGDEVPNPGERRGVLLGTATPEIREELLQRLRGVGPIMEFWGARTPAAHVPYADLHDVTQFAALTSDREPRRRDELQFLSSFLLDMSQSAPPHFALGHEGLHTKAGWRDNSANPEAGAIHYNGFDEHKELGVAHRKLLRLRQQLPHFRWAELGRAPVDGSEFRRMYPGAGEVFKNMGNRFDNPNAGGFLLEAAHELGNHSPVIALWNGDRAAGVRFPLPPGRWKVLVDGNLLAVDETGVKENQLREGATNPTDTIEVPRVTKEELPEYWVMPGSSALLIRVDDSLPPAS